MFFSRKPTSGSPAAPHDGAAAGTEAPGAASGKGRPTPKRREAEARSRRPLVGAAATSRTASLPSNATKAEKKAARKADREAERERRRVVREAYVTGDERYLPDRDRGPAKRYARDWVDSRVNVGEFFIPFALVMMFVSLLPSTVLPATTVQAATLVLLYGYIVLIGVDAWLTGRRVRKAVAERHGEAATQGVAWYAAMRTMQMRRTRLPYPQVKRGQRPD